MIKRLLAVLLLCASPVLAQVGPPSPRAGGGSGGTVDVDTILDAQFCVDSVGTDAYACSSAVCPAAIANGQSVIFQAGTLNTAAATFAFCGQAAKAVVRYNVAGVSTALLTGDILAKQPVHVIYNLTDDNWKMVSYPAAVPQANAANIYTNSNTFQGATGSYGGVTAVTTTSSTSLNTAGYLFTNTGDADGAAITLLDNPTAGTWWDFAITVAQTLTITAATGETLIHEGTTCGTSLTSNTIGSTIKIRTVIGGSGGTFMTFGAAGVWVCTP